VAHLKKCIIELKSTNNCLAHALITAIGRLDKISNYESYPKGWKIRPVGRDLLETTGIDLPSGTGIPELARFQEYFREYKILLYPILRFGIIMFKVRAESSKCLNLQYDDVERHYQMIKKITGAMARPHICKACNQSCRSNVMHLCYQTCSDYTISLHCAFEDIRITREECNRHFRSRTYFDNHKRRTARKTSMRR